ncbi:MAG: transporter substrate-binding domain-containing protein [Candidatus Midichloriaceae bacterium]
MTKSYKITVLAITALIIASIIFFVSKSQKNTNSVMSDALIVGVSPDYPPFEYTEDGEIIGFDIDFIQELGEKMGKKIEIREMEFSSLIPSLNSGKVDVIISSISRTSERVDNVSFSDPYYTSTFAIIMAKDTDAKTLDDFSKNAKIGVQTGTTMESFANSYNDSSDKSLEIVSLSSNFLLIEKLKLGEINALIVEDAQAPSFIKNIPELKSEPIEDNVYIDEEENSYVVAVKKGSSLVEKINKGIESLNANGQIELLLKKWNLR